MISYKDGDKEKNISQDSVRIESKWKQGSAFYPGIVEKVIFKDDGYYYDIKYDDEEKGEEKLVASKLVKIEAKWNKGFEYYSATITKAQWINPRKLYNIEFDDGYIEENVLPNFIRSPKQAFYKNDEIEARWKNEPYYYLGIIVEANYVDMWIMSGNMIESMMILKK